MKLKGNRKRSSKIKINDTFNFSCYILSTPGPSQRPRSDEASDKSEIEERTEKEGVLNRRKILKIIAINPVHKIQLDSIQCS